MHKKATFVDDAPFTAATAQELEEMAPEFYAMALEFISKVQTQLQSKSKPLSPVIVTIPAIMAARLILLMHTHDSPEAHTRILHTLVDAIQLYQAEHSEDAGGRSPTIPTAN